MIRSVKVVKWRGGVLRHVHETGVRRTSWGTAPRSTHEFIATWSANPVRSVRGWWPQSESRIMGHRMHTLRFHASHVRAEYQGVYQRPSVIPDMIKDTEFVNRGLAWYNDSDDQVPTRQPVAAAADWSCTHSFLQVADYLKGLLRPSYKWYIHAIYITTKYRCVQT